MRKFKTRVGKKPLRSLLATLVFRICLLTQHGSILRFQCIAQAGIEQEVSVTCFPIRIFMYSNFPRAYVSRLL